MNKFLVLVVVLFAVWGSRVMAIEEAAYQLVRQDGHYQLRDYQSYILAEVKVDGEFEKAGSEAFRHLFKYITGNNRPQSEIAMTAPVSQQATGESISMTAPVSQTSLAGQYVVSFMMPASYTLDSIPEPTDPRVSLRQVPAQRMAVVRYSGFWSQKNYATHKALLDAWIQAQGLRVTGEPVWARYNAPYIPWFLRRNEVLIPVAVE